MRRRREQRGARPANVSSPKVPNKLKTGKQQGLTNGKSESEEPSEQPIPATGSSSNKKSN